MKLLHTGDWHLGRLLYSQSLIDDQRILLDQVIDIAIEKQVNAVLVAGDIFDRAIPTPAAVTTLSRIIERLCVENKIPVVMITGNHDSEDRMDLAPLVFQKGGFHLRSRVTQEIEPVVVADKSCRVAIYPLPYAGPSRMREALDDDSVTDHNSGMKLFAERILAKHDRDCHSILLAHGWVTGGEVHGEERLLTVGTAGQVEASALEGFDYVAMGHLHRRQMVGSKRNIGYPGSLMQYDFGERMIKPSVNLITFDEIDAPSVEYIDLTPRRLLHTLHGKFDELMSVASDDERREHFVRVILTDDHPIHNPVSRLKDIYPYLLHMDYEHASKWGITTLKRSFEDIRRTSELELFTDFFKEMNGRPLDEEELKVITAVLNDIRAMEDAQ